MTQLKLTLLTLLFEFSAGLQLLLSGSHSDPVFIGFLATHMLASGVLASLVLLAMPKKYATPRIPTWLFFFCLSACIPILGVIGILTTMACLPLLPAPGSRQHFISLRLPELDPHEHPPGEAFRQAGLRQFLRNDKAPVEQRLRALVGLQNAPVRFASPLLRDLLAASSEDLRLLAYGMLETREKRINAEIHTWRMAWQDATDDNTRHAAAKRISALYWEVIYQGLAQGDLRRHAAVESLRFLEEALDANDASLQLRHGRLLHELGRSGEAETAYRRAIELGLPAPRVQPYLAEIAFERRDFAEVRRLLSSLNDYPDQRRIGPILDFWCHS